MWEEGEGMKEKGGGGSGAELRSDREECDSARMYEIPSIMYRPYSGLHKVSTLLVVL